MKNNFFALTFAAGLIGLTGLCAFGAEDGGGVLKTEEKSAVVIDDTKMQEKTEALNEKEAKKLEKEAKKLEEAKRKELKKEAKKNKTSEIQQDEAKETVETPKDSASEQKETIIEDSSGEKSGKDIVIEDTKKELQAGEKSESKPLVEDKKIKKEDVEEAFNGEKTETPKEIHAKDKEGEVSDVKENIKAPSDRIETLKEEIKEHEPLKETTVEDTAKEAPPKKVPAVETKNEAVPQTKMYRKNISYEDIDKNAVSINEFLQFTDKQNEKFSVFYYKTTSALNSYTSKIKAKEKQISDTRKENAGVKTQYEKLKKYDKELDFLLRERDEFYNKSLSEFNSMLTKKQASKWEVLQEMGYRFLPELE